MPMPHTACSLPFAALALLLAAPSLSAQRGATDRLLARALQQVHDGLERDVDLWSDHSTWDNAWVGRTAHFEVRTTHSYGEAIDLAQGLEAMLGHVQQALAMDFAPSERQHVFVFPDIAAYNTFGNANGEHHSSFYGSFFAPGHAQRPVATVWHENPTWLRMQVTHSFVHQYLAAAFPGRQIPTWLDEGLASYFTAYWDYAWSLGQFEQLKAADQLPRMRQLLRDGVDRYTPGAATNARLSMLGMTFYWLLRYREDTRTVTADEGSAQAPFRDYVTALLHGRPVEGLPFHALAQDPDALERALLEFEFPR
ncbi:MAG: hypothetical protein AB7O97_12345 [Planctomycetota bacterium]